MSGAPFPFEQLLGHKPFPLQQQATAPAVAPRAHHGFAQAAMGVAIPAKSDGHNSAVNDSDVVQERNKPAQTRPGHSRLKCPHCRHYCVLRTSRELGLLLVELTYGCSNLECGHTFVANTEIVRTLSPSATPDPAVNLPLSNHVRRDYLRAQLDFAASAEHQSTSTAPITGDLFAGQAPPD